MRAVTTLLACLVALPLALAGPLPRASNTTTSVPTAIIKPKTASGTPITVTGVNEYGLDVYLGIPFAEPPVGDLRFAHPQPKVYSGNVTATTPPPACLQDAGDLQGSYGISEDCLTLNILGPQGVAGTNAKLPVMVWIYGGGFTSGTGTTYNGPYLNTYAASTDRPFILVTFNYRLGIFGWGNGAEMAANGAANLALRDQILALQWVKENIKAFGGNPNKVTVFGESAGAISISCLMLNQSTDLFHGAIMMSGAQSTSPLGPTADVWQGPYDMVAQLTGCKNASTPITAAGNQSTFDCLKKVPAETLLNATITTKNNLLYALGFVWGPSVDGDIIPGAPWKLLEEGKFARIPFISGNNVDEGTLFVPTYLNTTQIPVSTLLDFLYPSPLNASIADEVTEAYPNVPALGAPFGTGNETFGLDPGWKQLTAIITDGAFMSRRRWFLRQANKHGFKKTWSYQWDGKTPGDPAYYGATHGRDVYYSFGAISTATNYTVADVSLSNAMMNYWINFAYYQDPNGKNIKKNKNCKSSNSTTAMTVLNQTSWAPHSYPKNKNSMYLSETNVSTIQDDFREEQMSVFFQSNMSQALFYKRDGEK